MITTLAALLTVAIVIIVILLSERKDDKDLIDELLEENLTLWAEREDRG